MEEVKTSKAKKKLTLFVALVVVVLTYRHNFVYRHKGLNIERPQYER